MAGVPHEIVGNELSARLKCIQECNRAAFANERCGTIYSDHGKPSADGGNGVAFFCISLFSNAQCVQLGLEGAPINYLREACHRSSVSTWGGGFMFLRPVVMILILLSLVARTRWA